MTKFTYTITDPAGVHARPAGALVKLAKEFACSVSIEHAGKTADAKRVFSIMALGIKCGDTLTFACDGADEAEAAARLAEALPGML